MDGTVTEGSITTVTGNLQIGDLGIVIGPISYDVKVTRGDNDGWVTAVGGFDNDNNDTEIGDENTGGGDKVNEEKRAFFGIDLSTVLTNTIVSATFNFRYNGTTQNPQSNIINPIEVDLVDFGAAVDDTDYNAPLRNAQNNFANFTISPSAGDAWYSIDCLPQVQYCLNNAIGPYNGSTNWFQIRMRPQGVEPQGDGKDDFYRINALESGGNNEAYLTLTYIGPRPADNNSEIRSLTGFNLGSIPAGAGIASAELHLNGYQVDGDSDNIKPIRIDHVDYDSTLDAPDYNGCTVLGSGIASFNPTLSTPKADLVISNLPMIY